MVKGNARRVPVGSLMKALYKSGMTREDIASKLRVSVSTVRSWEMEHRRPNWVIRKELERLLGRRE